MRKLGFILLMAGLLWTAFFSLEAGPLARAGCAMNRQKMATHRLNSVEQVAAAYTATAFRIAGFAQWGAVGGVVMLAGGIILALCGRRPSTADKHIS